MIKQLVVLALVGLFAIGASAAPADIDIETLQRVALGSAPSSADPERMLNAVNQLLEYYSKHPQTSGAGAPSQIIFVAMGVVGNVKKENCANMDEYNKFASMLSMHIGYLKYGAKYIEHSQDKQKKMC